MNLIVCLNYFKTYTSSFVCERSLSLVKKFTKNRFNPICEKKELI